MTRVPGSYLIVLHLAEASVIAVGKLGVFTFPAGWYVHIGSAMGGLEQRMAHHEHAVGRPHGHLDFLRTKALIREVFRVPSTHGVSASLPKRS